MAIVNSRAAIEPKTGKAAIFVNETIHSLMRKLFSNGEQGFAYDPSDLTALYQDAAGTIPVTVAGQPVGLMKDKSGRNNHAYQAVSASRPILQRNATTGAYYLAFDGADDFLQTNNINFTQTSTISIVTSVMKGLDSSRAMLLEYGTVASARSFKIEAPYAPASPSYTAMLTSINEGNYSRLVYSPYPALTPNVLSCVFHQGLSENTQRIKMRVDGALTQPTLNISQNDEHVPNNFAVVLPLYIGRRAGTSLPFNGHLYSLIGIGRLTTDSETLALEKVIAKNTGVTLNV